MINIGIYKYKQIPQPMGNSMGEVMLTYTLFFLGGIVFTVVVIVVLGMTEADNEVIRKAATKRVDIKKGVSVPETDPNTYMAKLVVASVAFPSLKDAALQESYGVKGAEDLLRKMLLPGEYSSLAEKVQQINGFDKDMNELVDDVKN